MAVEQEALRDWHRLFGLLLMTSLQIRRSPSMWSAPNMVEFGSSAYQRRSEHTSRLLGRLFHKLRGEGFTMSFTMEDFNRLYVTKYFKEFTPAERREALKGMNPEERREALETLTPEERRTLLHSLLQEERHTVLQSLPVQELLTMLSAEQVEQLREQLRGGGMPQPRKSRRKK